MVKLCGDGGVVYMVVGFFKKFGIRAAKGVERDDRGR